MITEELKAEWCKLVDEQLKLMDGANQENMAETATKMRENNTKLHVITDPLSEDDMNILRQIFIAKQLERQ